MRGAASQWTCSAHGHTEIDARPGRLGDGERAHAAAVPGRDADRPGRSRRQRQRRRHLPDLRRAASDARAQPDAYELRHARQLAAGGIQAVRGNGGGWRAARYAEGNAERQAIYRSPQALGPAYERPKQVTDERSRPICEPLLSTPQRTREVERFVNAFDCKHTLAIEARLEAAAGADADRLGNGRRLLRREVVTLAGAGDSRHEQAPGVPRCTHLLSRRSDRAISIATCALTGSRVPARRRHRCAREHQAGA